MKEFKLLITGGSSLTSKYVFSNTIEILLENVIKDRTLSFVTAMAPGADAMAYLYANQHGIKCYEYHPNRKYGAHAHMRMNAEMADFADGALLFCEPEEDVDYMIDFMQRQNKTVAVVHYST